MPTVPFTQCCSMLAIDSKTLRQWLKHSQLSLHQSSTDARVKCLTIEQVQQLATLHGRPIPSLEAATPSPLTSQLPIPLVSTLPETETMKILSSLQTQVATMQQQVTSLALELLQERSCRYEHRLQALEALLQTAKMPEAPPQPLPTMEAASQQQPEPNRERCPYPAEIRARSRVLPLVEYTRDATYVLFSPQEGELSFLPDSPEWFDWIASLSSFRFFGKHGRFTASRGGNRHNRTRRWYASLYHHQQNHRRYIAITPHVTIERLEHVAAQLQSHVQSL